MSTTTALLELLTAPLEYLDHSCPKAGRGGMYPLRPLLDLPLGIT